LSLRSQGPRFGQLPCRIQGLTDRLEQMLLDSFACLVVVKRSRVTHLRRAATVRHHWGSFCRRILR
jgi:hypothetical protein